MKYMIKQAILLLSLAIAIASCNKEPEYYNPQAPEDQMHVTADVSELTLVKEDANQEAVTFTWDEAHQYGEGYEIEYIFRLRNAANPTQVTDTVLVKGGRSITFTVAEVNATLAEWGIFPGDPAQIMGQVIASVVSEISFKMPEQSISSPIAVVGYDIANYLSIVATSGDTERIAPMKEVVVGQNRFLLSENLNSGDKLRFIRSAVDGTWPAYVDLDENGTLKLAEEAEGVDFQPEIPTTTTGVYSNPWEVSVDMNNFSYVIQRSMYNLPNGLIAIVGDAVDAGWSSAEAIAKCSMVQDSNDPAIWTYTGRFKGDGSEEDAFKLLMENGWGRGFWAPAANTDPFVVSFMDPTQSHGDVKWRIPNGTDETFTLTVNLRDLTLILE